MDYDAKVRSNKNRFGVPDAEMFALQNGTETKRYFLCFGVTTLVFLPKFHRKNQFHMKDDSYLVPRHIFQGETKVKFSPLSDYTSHNSITLPDRE